MSSFDDLAYAGHVELSTFKVHCSDCDADVWIKTRQELINLHQVQCPDCNGRNLSNEHSRAFVINVLNQEHEANTGGFDINQLFVPLNANMQGLVDAQQGVDIEALMASLLSNTTYNSPPTATSFVRNLQAQQLIMRDFIKILLRLERSKHSSSLSSSTSTPISAPASFTPMETTFQPGLTTKSSVTVASVSASPSSGSSQRQYHDLVCIQARFGPDIVGLHSNTLQETEIQSLTSDKIDSDQGSREEINNARDVTPGDDIITEEEEKRHPIASIMHAQGLLVTCEPLTCKPRITNSVAVQDAIVYGRRGDISFIDKSLVLQKCGAKACIISQSESDNGSWPYHMTNTSKSINNDSVVIPTVMISYKDGCILERMSKECNDTDVQIKANLTSFYQAIACPVCREDFTLESQVLKLPCTHAFHSPCLLPWLKQRNTCPLCRHILPTNEGATMQDPANAPQTLLQDIMFN